MARIAFAWELGAEFGHAVACNDIARTLRARGHHIGYFFRELYQLDFLADCAAQDIYQAPVLIVEGKGMGNPSSFADILIGCGYDTADHLAGVLGGWISLLSRWKPDIVVSDTAPTALLASWVLGLRRVNYGNGFGIPPPFSPLPAFRFDVPVSQEHLVQADAHALASVNGALARFGVSPLSTLAQVFSSDEDFLATFPELDSYGNRPRTGYWGPRLAVDNGVTVHWPGGTGKRIAVYVKRTLPLLDPLISMLASSPHRVVAYIPELEQQRVARLRSDRRIVAERAMRLGPLLPDCDLFISHGSTVAVGTLMAGVPQLTMPTQYEQYTTARRMEQLGAGLWLDPTAPATTLRDALVRMLSEDSFPRNAKAFARRYPHYSPGEAQRRIVRRMEELLTQPPRLGALPRMQADPILPRTPPGAIA